VLPGVIGALQATEALKVITGIGAPLIGRLLTYDALDMRFSEFHLQRRPDCAVCGDAPSIHQPQDPPAMSSPGDTADIRHLSAPDLEALLKAAGNSPPPLIDVREVYEFDAGHLRGSVNIPLSQLPGRLTELAASSAPVFICRSGGRSFAACQMALAADIASPANLEGGLLGWAAEVDPALRVA
jgi:adenylyltransferase/sulfurtransferase